MSEPPPDSAATTRTAGEWDEVYTGTPPWDTGRPQPVYRALAEAGALTGRVLDVGCGTGEHTLLAAAHGAVATGVDIAPRAVAAARAKAAERGLSAEFLVGDALHLERLGTRFDVVLDSGVFHVFDDEHRPRYVASLAAVLRPGGRYHLLCFSDRTPGTWGPRRVTEQELRTAFADGWVVERIEPAEFELADANPFGPGASAWFATFARSA
jgi:SAM-dependent methyltransferase